MLPHLRLETRDYIAECCRFSQKLCFRILKRKGKNQKERKMSNEVKQIPSVAENPAMFPWWKAILERMLEKEPQAALDLWRRRKLAAHLKAELERALSQFMFLQRKGIEKEHARTQAFDTMIAPSDDLREPDPLPENLENQIRAWALREEQKDEKRMRTTE